MEISIEFNKMKKNLEKEEMMRKKEKTKNTTQVDELEQQIISLEEENNKVLRLHYDY